MQKQLALITESLAKERVSSKKCDETEKTPVAKAKGRCHNCHELGHYRFECPALVKKPSGTTGTGDATTRTIASGVKKKRLTADQGSTGTLTVAQKMSGQPQPTNDQSSMEAWLDIVKRCPPPSFSVGVPHQSETTAWNRQTPSGQWKSYGSSTQHTQQLPEVHLDWPTQRTQQSTQHAQQLPEVHPKQSTQHAQQSTHLTQQLKPNTSHLSDTTGRSEQHPPRQNTGAASQHAQQTQETLQHAVESELPTRVKREVSSPENKTCKAGNTLFIEVKIGKRRCPALLDTGSEVTLLPKHLADLSQLNKSSRTLRAANGTLINIVGEWRTVVTIGPVSATMNFIVSDPIDELLVGIDWMRDNSCVLSFADLTLELQGYRFPLLTKTKSGSCNRVILEEGVILPAKSEAMVSCKVVYADLHKKLPAVGITGNKECAPGVKTARCLLELGSGTHLPLRVLNVSNRSMSLQEGMALCPLQEVESVIEEQKETLTEQQDKDARASSDQIQQILAGVHPDVPTEHRIRLRNLLAEYADILSRVEFDMGLTDLIQHEIDTGQERPVRQALRRTPMVHNQVIDSHIQSMLKQGLIEPSHGDWSSNIVLVLKKDKSYRFCLDCRQLNGGLQKRCVSFAENWRLTRCPSRVILVFNVRPCGPDTTKCHWIQRTPTRRPLWPVLAIGSGESSPMGLCNSASTFQRLMNLVLSGLTYKSCLVYLDDIIIMARSLEEHQVRLEEVFSRIRAAKLKLRPDKCSILRREVTFLGHVVSTDGIAMDERKLEVVRNWATPKNLKETRAYVGFCSYYRRYLKDFSALAAPLHALTRKTLVSNGRKNANSLLTSSKRG